MDLRFNNLVWRLERAAASNPASRVHLQLAQSLRQLAAEIGKDTAAADEAYHDIQRAIEDLQSRKLSDLRRRLLKGRPTGEPDEATASRLVRAKAYELGLGQMRHRQHEAERRALQDFPLDEERRRVILDISRLRPAERRAVEIIGGAQRKARKNPTERDAIILANAVIADWNPRPTRKPGRPAGSRLALNQNTMALPAVAEIIEVVLPLIDQFAGPTNSSSAIKAVSTAIKAAGLTSSPELVARTMKKQRRKGSAATL